MHETRTKEMTSEDLRRLLSDQNSRLSALESIRYQKAAEIKGGYDKISALVPLDAAITDAKNQILKLKSSIASEFTSTIKTSAALIPVTPVSPSVTAITTSPSPSISTMAVIDTYNINSKILVAVGLVAVVLLLGFRR